MTETTPVERLRAQVERMPSDETRELRALLDVAERLAGALDARTSGLHDLDCARGRALHSCQCGQAEAVRALATARALGLGRCA